MIHVSDIGIKSADLYIHIQLEFRSDQTKCQDIIKPIQPGFRVTAHVCETK